MESPKPLKDGDIKSRAPVTRRDLFRLGLGSLAAGALGIVSGCTGGGAPRRAQYTGRVDSDPTDEAGYGRTGVTDQDPTDQPGNGRGTAVGGGGGGGGGGNQRSSDTKMGDGSDVASGYDSEDRSRPGTHVSDWSRSTNADWSSSNDSD